jgi:ATP-dependent Clp protease ATP-binding subunit ClpX
MIPSHPNIIMGSKTVSTTPGLLPTPTELIAILDRKVIGQVAAKRDLSVAAYNHFLACAYSDIQGGPVENAAHAILIGPTGCGKSHLLKTLRECLGVPMFYVSCTGLTQNGYKGTNINEVLERLEQQLLDEEHTQPAIVVWDEVDKLRELPNHHPFASRGVQQDLLTFLDGTTCGKSGQMDSSRFLNVACGAFVELDQMRKQKRSSQIGFLAPPSKEPSLELIESLTTQHLIDYGLIPEFIGRFASVTELDPLNSETLRMILCKAEGSVMVQKRHLFELHGISLEFTDEALDEMVTKALKMRTGARSLKRILESTLDGIDHRLPDLAALGVSSIVVTAETVRGEKPATEKITAGDRPLCRLHDLRQRAGDYGLWKKKSAVTEPIW